VQDDDRPQVTELVAPRWADGRNTETVTPAPTSLQVEQALRQLDGRQLNDLYLKTSDALTYLGICGGAGRYMVTFTDHHERFAQLLNTQDPSEAEEHIMCGGQLTTFPRRHLVSLQTALSAAVHYLHTAQAAPALSWEWYR
jgi:hypothetical protein